jgi:hypothetical protein
MQAKRSTRHVGLVKATRILLGLVAGTSILPGYLGLENNKIGEFIKGLKDSKGNLQGRSSILVALASNKQCSNELWECQGLAVLANVTDLRCFSICISVGTGCRSCCPDGACYQPPEDGGGLGFCRDCPDEGDDERCARPFSREGVCTGVNKSSGCSSIETVLAGFGVPSPH